MARRNGRKGDYLLTSDYSGCAEYASRMVKDYWGNYGLPNEIVQRNLQEIATPFDDPHPVPNYRGPQYEATNGCDFETQPLYIGKTTRRFPDGYATSVLGLDVGIGQAAVGCTFVVR